MTEEMHWRNMPLPKLRALYETERKRGLEGSWVASAPHTIWVMGRVLRERTAAEEQAS